MKTASRRECRSGLETLISSMLLALALSATVAEAAPGTTRISVSTLGEQADNGTIHFSMSADGRYMAFDSEADNLVAGDANGVTDVFVHDTVTLRTWRVSVSSGGGEADGASTNGQISADGRYVVFQSSATNLVLGDTNGADDIFVHEIATGATIRVSLSVTGAELNGSSSIPSVSGDGRRVAYLTLATNVDSQSTSPIGKICLTDVGVSTEVLLSGRVGFLLYDNPILSADGRRLAFDVFSGYGRRFDLLDLDTRMTVPVLVPAFGDFMLRSRYRFPALSVDGRFVVFTSTATNLVAEGTDGTELVFLRDTLMGQTTLESLDTQGSPARSASYTPAVSDDGRTVSFATRSALVPEDGDTILDIYVRDRVNRSVDRVSVAAAGGSADGASAFTRLTADGRKIGFLSLAANLVAGDSSAALDLFLNDRGTLRLDSLTPASGSEDGGDVMNIYGSGFTDVADTRVEVDSVAATLVSVGPGLITARTPPGRGQATVAVSNSNGRDTLVRAYTYLSPYLAARLGDVNVALGDREDVLFVDDSRGDDVNRELTINVRDPIRVALSAPSSLSSANYALYAWLGEPGPGTLAPQPLDLGVAVFPTPLSGGSPQPRVIWNTIAGSEARLGSATLPSSAAPTVVLDRAHGAPRPITIALQGFIRDDGSRVRAGLSITNAVILHVR